MFAPDTYAERRATLLDTLREARDHASGLVLVLGNEESPVNYPANAYPFRQDSSFLYYVGADAPGLDAVLDLDTGETTLFGTDAGLDEIVWTGEQTTVHEHAAAAQIANTASASRLGHVLQTATDSGRDVHILPPYRARHRERLQDLLQIPASAISDFVSESLIDAVIAQRSVKSEPELDELSAALETTAQVHLEAMHSAAPGVTEQVLAGRLRGVAHSHGGRLSFTPICSVRGDILHNHHYDHTLEAGQLLLVDAGATAPSEYAGDVTRVSPVSGTFTARQRDIYQAVLDAQLAAIDSLAPDVPFLDVHRTAARVLTERLIDVGLMNGPANDAVDAGAHALFFPHGLGHMMGLDVHDMEGLGEDRVGYADDQTRSEQFGLNALRLARPLQPGFVLTVEPGCYFIPKLIERWSTDGRHGDFINYDVVDDFVGFGGIRIEDDFVITGDGAELIGPEIPKTIEEVENAMGC